MPLQATSGAASYDAFGGGVAAIPQYIEEVFSTYLYTGNAGSQTITNGIDLSTKGGLVWIKDRSQATSHYLQDTANGANNFLRTDKTEPLGTLALNTVFNTNGFSQNNSFLAFNGSGDNYVSWSIAKAPKFFDIVTYTGDDTAGRAIPHNLGSEPAFIVVKNTTNASQWICYHRSLTADNEILLNLTNASAASSKWNNQTPTSTNFYVSGSASVNGSGNTYVAYLFAHNAGGFGLTGTDNVISCGSYTGTGATGNAITLGYEAQWVMVKRTDSTADWEIMDAMRSGYLEANTSDAESGGNWFNLSGDNFFPTATGFQINTSGAAWNASGGTYIYIAIRRGPMKVPTDATKVFAPVAYTGSGSGATGQTITAGFPIDLASYRYTNQSYGGTLTDRLRGFTGTSSKALYTYATAAEATDTEIYGGDSNTSIKSYGFSASYNFIGWYLRRAPSFFDEVCYTGNGSTQTLTHNLGAVPELIIFKSRSAAQAWWTYSATLGYTQSLRVNVSDAAQTGETRFGSSTPTSTNFYVDATTSGGTNSSSSTYVAYLFATCAGVSKVGSYTGTGTTLQVNCGFTAGARFVLIKRTDSTGDWYVWDSARGIVSGNDPYILLNNDLAQVTSTDYIDTYSAGFEISSTAPAAINASGGTFIFLAIA